MRRRQLIGFLGLILFATALLLWSQPRAMILVPKSLVLSANPSSIPAARSVPVTFTAQFRGAAARQVVLQRASPNGFTQVGTFQPTGNGSYTLQLPGGFQTATSISFVAHATIADAAPTTTVAPPRIAALARTAPPAGHLFLQGVEMDYPGFTSSSLNLVSRYGEGAAFYSDFERLDAEFRWNRTKVEPAFGVCAAGKAQGRNFHASLGQGDLARTQ
jgi:hypothetical protein